MQLPTFSSEPQETLFPIRRWKRALRGREYGSQMHHPTTRRHPIGRELVTWVFPPKLPSARSRTARLPRTAWSESIPGPLFALQRWRCYWGRHEMCATRVRRCERSAPDAIRGPSFRQRELIMPAGRSGVPRLSRVHEDRPAALATARPAHLGDS